jgi:P27 family predicted phage terminase small subunit
MGRKPLPTEVKKLQGTLRPERVHADQMKPEPYVSIPLPPEHLGEIGKREWTIIVSNYVQLGMLSGLDSGMIAAYCSQIELYVESISEVKKTGKLIIARNVSAPNPLMKVANDALDRSLKIEVELGLTPSARTKISVSQINQPETQQDEFDI